MKLLDWILRPRENVPVVPGQILLEQHISRLTSAAGNDADLLKLAEMLRKGYFSEAALFIWEMDQESRSKLSPKIWNFLLSL